MAESKHVPEFEQLPALYQRWVGEWLPGPIPRESNATCLDCAMCAAAPGDGGPDMGFYERSLKCCSYFPDLPNFLVGRALAGDNPGAAALRGFVAGDGGGRFHATPRVVQPNSKLGALYDTHGRQGFGRDRDLLCPYAFDVDADTGPLCGLWAQRNGVCSTFFCKHVKGQTGFQFWQTMRGLLTSLEWSLSWWAITEVLDRPEAAITAGARRAGEQNGIALRPDAWTFWKGSRPAFYEACADRVESLSGAEAIEIAGVDARLYLMELKARYDAVLETDPPDNLRAAPYTVLRQAGGRAMVQAMTCSEPVEAPAALVPLISYFDGQPNETTLEAIREATRVRLDPKLVRRLYDFGILEPAPEGPAAHPGNPSGPMP